METRFDAYDNAFLLTVDGAKYTNLPAAPTVEDNEQTLFFSTVTLAGLDVHREVYVPEASGNFARLLDVLHNPTAAPIMVSVVLSGGLGGFSPVSVISTSSGDATLTTADTWFASDESGVQNFAPELAFVMQDGAGSVSVSDVELNTGMSAFHWTFNVTVGAGETVRLLS
ncbi:MAG: hypothetical protein HYV60_00500, partial [Planctomycetia bacterium]|nr:hypothetical protein [Planctomycetia bacterium]